LDTVTFTLPTQEDHKLGFATPDPSNIHQSNPSSASQIHQLQKPQGLASRAAEASAMTASHGNLPVAASPLSITASVPSQTAFLGGWFTNQLVF